jgi:hypothetical protein
MDQQHKVLCDRIDALWKSFLSQHLRDPEVLNLDQDVFTPEERSPRPDRARRDLATPSVPKLVSMYMQYEAKAEADDAGNSGGYAWEDTHRLLWSAAPK